MKTCIFRVSFTACVCESTWSSHVIFTHFSPTDSPNLSLPLHTARSRARRKRPKGRVCGLMNVFQNGSHTKKRDGPSTLRDGRRLWLVKGSWGGPDADVGELLHIPRWAVCLSFFFPKYWKQTTHVKLNTTLTRWKCITIHAWQQRC